MADETTPRMSFQDARQIDPTKASDSDLVAAWHAYASQISHHEADDYGNDWRNAAPLKPKARELEQAIRARGLERPGGTYLLSKGDRINWETGEWSPGWDWKKAATA